MENVVSCPLCNSLRKSPFEGVHDSDRMILYQICRSCGLVCQSPRMVESELKQFYEREYRIERQESESPIEKDLLMQDARARAVLEMIQPHLSAVSRHLDVGSSSGALLNQFHEHYGCANIGIEPGEVYRQFSESQGLKVYPSIEALEDIDEPPFDLISMMHVLEHVVDPVQTLRSLRESRMMPGGFLLLEVPNLIEHDSLELSHLYAFTRSTIKAVVQQAGFRVLWSKSHGSFRSPILKLFITLLAQARDEAQSPPNIYSSPIGVKTRRRLGKYKRDFFTNRFPDWTWQSPSQKPGKENLR